MAHFPVYGRKWVRQGAPRLTHYLPITAVFAVYGLFMAHINYPRIHSVEGLACVAERGEGLIVL